MASQLTTRPLATNPARWTAATGNIYAAFSPAIIVGVRPDQTVPSDDKWQKLKCETVQSSQYQQTLWSLSIGVVSGPSSFDLCGIHFSALEPFREFIEANPGLADTLVTASPDEIVAWIRLNGFCPPTVSLHGCEWVSSGVTMVFARHSLESKCFFINFCRPLVVEFKTIIWTPEDQAVFRPQLIAHKWGSLTRLDQKRGRALNENFWAAYFVAEHPCRYAPMLRKFLRPGAVGDIWKPVYDEAMLAGLQEFLITKAAPTFEMHKFCNQSQLRQILDAMRLIAPMVQSVTEIEVLEQFVLKRVEKNDGSDTTVSELFCAYEKHCRSLGLSVLSKTEFGHLIPGLMRNHFSVAKSKSIQRNGVNKRGFRNVRLK